MKKPRKIKRYRRIYSRRRSSGRTALKIGVFVVAIAAVGFIGYSVAGPFMDFINGKIEPSVPSSDSLDSTQPDSSDSSLDSSEPQVEDTALKAVTLSFETAQDPAALSAFLDQAKQGGATAVVIELKGTTGRLLYASTLQQAAEYGAVVEGALDLNTLVSAIETSGLKPVAKLSAFMDRTAPSVARNNGYMYENTNSAWWDNAVDNGGKPWLNPYKVAACDYLVAVQNEVIASGFETVIWHKVEFPEVRTFSSANMGAEAEGVSQQQALSNFIARCESEAEAAGGVVYISYPVSASFGRNASWFGGDPAALGAKHVAPLLDFSSLSGLTVGETALDTADIQQAAKQVLTVFQPKVGEAELLPMVEDAAQADAVQAALTELELEGYVIP